MPLPKGCHQTEETKRKMRENHLSKKNPQKWKEALEKSSLAHKGKKRPPFSEEWRRKMSESRKGIVVDRSNYVKRSGWHHTAESNLKNRLAHLGKSHPISEETKKKISIANKGRILDPNTRKGKNNSFYGKHHSEKSKMRMLIASKGNKYHLGHPHSEASKKMMSEAHKMNVKNSERLRELGKLRIGKKLSKELYDKTINHLKKMMNKPEIKQKISESLKAYYETHPEAVEARRQGAVNMGGKFPKTNTSIEVKIQDFLREKGIKFKTDYSLLGITRSDVFIPPKICIYADGDYWHRIPKRMKRDEKQTKILTDHGFIVARFWEKDINQNFDIVSSSIMNLLGSIL